MAIALDTTRMSATALAAAIRAGETTSREVVEAHIDVLERTRSRINALAETRLDAARAEADAADARIAAADGDELPPLLGVPCTIKESMALVGMPNCAGLVARREHRSTENAVVVQRVIDAGAIPLGVTNTSEMTMWIESYNRVYGRTNNAYDPRRTAGGSSGGEGSAVGTGVAPFGIGSDIAGSIRIPAFFNGVFGHKPSVGLVPHTGQFPFAEGEAARMLGVGPLTRRAEDLMPLLRVLSGPDGADPLVTSPPRLGDPGAVDMGGLDVVVGDSTSYVPVSRELRAAREQAAGALAHAGARVRREPMKGLRRALELYLACLGSGSPTPFAEILAGAGVADFSLRRAAGDLLRRRGDHTLPTLILVLGERLNHYIPDSQTRRAVAAAHSLRDEFAGVIGDGVLLHPPHARVAPRHGATVGRAWAMSATAIFNVLEAAVTQVPLGLNRRGLPLGVQVAAAPGNDHVAIACAIELERAFGGWVPPQ